MRWIKKLGKRKMAGVILTVFAALLWQREAQAAQNVSLSLSVTQIFSAETAVPDEGQTFAYRLIPEGEDIPLPADGKKEYDFQITGSDTAELSPILYEKTGIYTYRLLQVVPEEKKEVYTYDSRVYTIHVYVKNGKEGLITEVTATDAKGTKYGDLKFTNTYQEKVESIENKTVKTGEDTSKDIYVGLLLISMVILCMGIWQKKGFKKSSL